MFTAARNAVSAMVSGAALLAVSVATAAPPLRAQPPRPPSAFEVASVRLIPPGKEGMISISPPGSPTFTATINLENLIALAYGVDSDNILNAPSWLGSQQYDITAKAEGNPRLTSEQLKAPLQKLLEERFHLVVHRQTKEGSGYALVAAKGGPKLFETKGEAPHAYILKGGLHLQNSSLDSLAGALKIPAGRPVVNETGIKGQFDIQLRYAPEGATNSELPSMFTALREQLGLQLVSRKVPVATLVIDRVERVPSEN